MNQTAKFTGEESVVIQHPKLVFTKQQVQEQKKFKKELEKGNVKVAFSGTFEDGIKFLRETGRFVDAFNHSIV